MKYKGREKKFLRIIQDKISCIRFCEIVIIIGVNIGNFLLGREKKHYINIFLLNVSTSRDTWTIMGIT